jgi:hypothetical protein
MSVRVEGGYNSLKVKRVEDMSATERKGK